MAAITNNNGDLSWGGLVNAVQNIEDATSMSLFQYTRRSIVSSRVYIEDTLANEEIMTPLMLNIMNLYVGLIMTAMNMNQYVQGTKRVRDSMSVVATEDFQPIMNIEKSMRAYFLRGDDNDSILDHLNPFHEDNDDNKSGAGTSKSGVIASEPRQDITIPSGRIVQIEFGNGDTDKKFTVNLFVQLQPNVIPQDVARQFVGINFKPAISQRYMQAGVGEIKFWSDFVLGNDLRKQRLKASKKDKTGMLQQMIDRKENALSNYWLKLLQVTPERQNIANTILVFEKNNFDKACSASGINLKTYSTRQNFFIATMSMMVCIVDPMYNKVQMYYNGITDPSVFTFDQMKRNSKTEATDILAMMKNYAQGMAPKF